MIMRATVVLMVLFLGSCSQKQSPEWIEGRWEIAISKEIIEVTKDSLTFTTNKRKSVSYKYRYPDSTLVLRIPDSEKSYLHDMNVKIERISSTKDTIWFSESDFETHTFAVKQK